MLQSLFNSLGDKLTQYREAKAAEYRRENYINQIVENMIDDIDPRLRSISGYKKILKPCVERILNYSQQVCAKLPGPIEFSQEGFRNNPTVRALFANHKKMAEVFSHCEAVQEFFRAYPSADEAYMIVGMRKIESKVFGVEQHGDILRKDVAQTNVSFEDYRITHPSLNEDQLRFNLRDRALHECVAQTIDRLMAMSECESELEEQELMLKMKLGYLRNEKAGLTSMLQDNGELTLRIREIKEKLDKIQNQHQDINRDIGTLNSYLEKAADLLHHPESLIEVSQVSLCLDKLNRLIESKEVNEEDLIKLAQITFSGKEKRVGLLATFPRKELLLTEKHRPVYVY